MLDVPPRAQIFIHWTVLPKNSLAVEQLADEEEGQTG